MLQKYLQSVIGIPFIGQITKQWLQIAASNKNKNLKNYLFLGSEGIINNPSIKTIKFRSSELENCS